MSNETYTLLDAMREEIDFLSELKKLSDKEEKYLLSASYAHQHSMLKRILIVLKMVTNTTLVSRMAKPML